MVVCLFEALCTHRFLFAHLDFWFPARCSVISSLFSILLHKSLAVSSPCPDLSAHQACQGEPHLARWWWGSGLWNATRWVCQTFMSLENHLLGLPGDFFGREQSQSAACIWPWFGLGRHQKHSQELFARSIQYEQKPHDGCHKLFIYYQGNIFPSSVLFSCLFLSSFLAVLKDTLRHHGSFIRLVQVHLRLIA